ncbi:MAG: PqqD family protein [Planctomycetes bacterium]|nr:PqqD family protein [Planctomycetota bacterium]MCC7399469.1 PqqD family protein [Planctomycetota bacterium]
MKRARQNLYHLSPAHAVPFEVGADGMVVLLVPRFEGRWLTRLLGRFVRRPNIRIRLDALGSFVWQQCDGTATVTTIAARAAVQFGDEPEVMLHRTGAFLAKLDGERVVTMQQPDATGAR